MTAPTPPPIGGGLTASSLLTGVLDLLKRHPVPLLLPLVVLGVLTSGGGGDPGPGFRFDMNGGPPDETLPWELWPLFAVFGTVFLLVAILVLILVMLLYVAAWALTTREALTATTEGRALDFGAEFRALGGRWRDILVTGALGAVLTFLGFLALIVPGILLMVGWTPWAAVVLRENRSGLDALGRAWELTRGHRLDLFLLYLAGFGVSLAAGIFVGWLPLIGDVLSSAVRGAVTAAYAVMGALYYLRRTATPAAPGEPRPPSGGPAADEGY